jgi:hypothetical protein
MNRRDILKLFGAGAAIVPIIGGTPDISAEARLIEPAKIIPAPASSIEGSVVYPGMFDLREPVSLTVIIERPSGQRQVIQGKTFILKCDYTLKEFTSPIGPVEVIADRHPRIRWALEGEFAVTPMTLAELPWRT